MNIVSLGFKGGIGKTTIALYLASKLSIKHNLLFIDYDYLSFASMLLGNYKPGLLDSIIKGELKSASELLAKYNNMNILKVFSDPFQVSLKQKYIDVIKSKIIELTNNREFVIIDTYTGIEVNDPIISGTLEGTNNADSYLLFLTDPISINSTILYAKQWNFGYKGLILNMIPPIPEEIEQAENVLTLLFKKEKLFDLIVISPFDERLYNYKYGVRSETEIKVLNKLLDSLLNKEKGVIIEPY